MAQMRDDSLDLTPRLEGRFRVGGRSIGFAEYGSPAGRAVLWFHGTPGGRRQLPVAARAAAAARDVRLIALERPGSGESARHRYPNLLGWADDVGVLADRLGIDRFACVGLSGGGPYVLACAARHPARMVGGAVLGGVAPARGPEAIGGGLVGLLARAGPAVDLAREPLSYVGWAVLRTLMPLRSQMFDAYMRISPPGDQRVFARPEMKAMFLDDFVRTYRRQLHGPVADVALFIREWGFSLRDVRVPIRFWHGDSDRIVPLAHAQHMSQLVPDSELRIRPGESHLGGLDAAEEIFDVLLDLWAPSGQARETGTS
jgi:pimeloyl-ACP methyl ester carboxylesterase